MQLNNHEQHLLTSKYGNKSYPSKSMTLIKRIYAKYLLLVTVRRGVKNI